MFKYFIYIKYIIYNSIIYQSYSYVKLCMISAFPLQSPNFTFQFFFDELRET